MARPPRGVCVLWPEVGSKRRGFWLGVKMKMQQATIAERTSKPPTGPPRVGAGDRLDALGRQLYGEQWITPMARDVKIHPDILSEWFWGRR